MNRLVMGVLGSSALAIACYFPGAYYGCWGDGDCSGSDICKAGTCVPGCSSTAVSSSCDSCVATGYCQWCNGSCGQKGGYCSGSEGITTASECSCYSKTACGQCTGFRYAPSMHCEWCLDTGYCSENVEGCSTRGTASSSYECNNDYCGDGTCDSEESPADCSDCSYSGPYERCTSHDQCYGTARCISFTGGTGGHCLESCSTASDCSYSATNARLCVSVGSSFGYRCLLDCDSSTAYCPHGMDCDPFTNGTWGYCQ